MERQLALKGICSIDEWKELKEDIHYDFLKDNNFTELKETELLISRLQTMQLIDPYIGTYFSKNWIRKKVLHLNEEEMEQIDGELKQEAAEQEVLVQQQQQQPSSIDQAFAAETTPQTLNKQI
jgi:hypothetical protein